MVPHPRGDAIAGAHVVAAALRDGHARSFIDDPVLVAIVIMRIEVGRFGIGDRIASIGGVRAFADGKKAGAASLVTPLAAHLVTPLAAHADDRNRLVPCRHVEAAAVGWQIDITTRFAVACFPRALDPATAATGDQLLFRRPARELATAPRG